MFGQIPAAAFARAVPLYRLRTSKSFTAFVFIHCLRLFFTATVSDSPTIFFLARSLLHYRQLLLP
jgi:hypothetical protein